MKRTFDIYDFIKSMNLTLLSQAKRNNHSRNYISFIRPLEEYKLNIVGELSDPVSNELSFTRFSFGMTPDQQFENYLYAICGGSSIFSSANKNQFIDFVKEHRSSFFIDEDEFKTNKLSEIYSKDELQEALFAKCIIQASFIGRFEFKVENVSMKTDVMKLLSKDSFCKICEKEGLLHIHGRPSEDSLDILDKKYRLSRKNDVLTITSNLEAPISFRELYNNRELFYLYFRTTEKALYSGTIPRLLEVNYIKPELSNRTVARFELKLGCTSFFTMWALGKTDVMLHPFLCTQEQNYKNIIDVFDEFEWMCQKEFTDSMNRQFLCSGDKISTDQLILIINQYLEKSMHIHNVNVSGNIITSDRYCLYSQRGKNVTDAGNIYCSVNGGSEILDKTIPFYRASHKQDLPTLLFTDELQHFGGELSREAIGELGLIDTSDFWDYYGISAMMYEFKSVEEMKVSNKRSWLHFNVIAQRQCLDSFQNVIDNNKHAIESFENERIFGYRLELLKNRKQWLTSRGLSLFKWILENSDLLTALVLPFAFLLNIDSILVLILAILNLIVLISKIVKHLSERKRKSVLSKIVDFATKEYVSIFTTRKLGKDNLKDPIFMLLTDLQLMKALFDI